MEPGKNDPSALSERIDRLRLERGISERELGRQADVGDWIRQLRIGKISEPSAIKLAKVASVLGVSLDDLLKVEGRAGKVTQLSAYRATHDELEQANTPIDEIDVRPAAGGPAARREKIIGRWALPKVLLQMQTSAGADELKVMAVYGDFMVPDFRPGERILVDTDAKVPSPPGVFVLHDGFALMLARLQIVPNSSPPLVRIIPRNDQYETYERPLSELEIFARVTGKWLWT